ncbi:hypothetical protein [Roseicyclus sp.]|uniref:hypothetical protein n=1 Tax=Roseicyclus sp. TaxID=1914329 RepID=UPI001BCB8644|nr:hypothetical protein [Roseicyclus sp.]
MIAGRAHLFWLLPGLIAMAVLFVWPIAGLVVLSLDVPASAVSPYAFILNEPIYRRVMFNTAISSLGTTFLCLLIGYPVAYAIHHHPAAVAVDRARVGAIFPMQWALCRARFRG